MIKVSGIHSLFSCLKPFTVWQMSECDDDDDNYGDDNGDGDAVETLI